MTINHFAKNHPHLSPIIDALQDAHKNEQELAAQCGGLYFIRAVRFSYRANEIEGCKSRQFRDYEGSTSTQIDDWYEVEVPPEPTWKRPFTCHGWIHEWDILQWLEFPDQRTSSQLAIDELIELEAAF